MFSDWINTPGQDRCYLVEANYLLGGVEHTLRLSTHPFRSAATDTPAFTPYPEIILDMGSFDREAAELFTGQSRVGLGDITLFIDSDILNLIKNANFNGSSLTIRCGDAGWPLADFGILVKEARIKSLLPVNYNEAKLSFNDRAVVFNVPLQTETIASGPNAGALKPIAMGTCFDVTPLLLDESTNTYMFSDSGDAAITSLMENGNSISFTDNGDGTATPTNNVTGRITGNVTTGVLLQSAEDLINYIIIERMGLDAPLDSGVLPDYDLGLYVDDDTTIAEALDAICQSVGAAWYYDRLNQFRLSFYNGPGTASAVLAPDDIEDDTLKPRRIIPPVKKIRLGYGRNYTPMPDGIAGVVHDTQPELASRLSKEYQYAEAENAGITNQHPDARLITVETLIVSLADAQTEANRRAALGAVRKSVYEATAFCAPFVMNLGQTISVRYPQYFEEGAAAVITRLKDRMNEDLVDMEFVK